MPGYMPQSKLDKNSAKKRPVRYSMSQREINAISFSFDFSPRKHLFVFPRSLIPFCLIEAIHLKRGGIEFNKRMSKKEIRDSNNEAKRIPQLAFA